MHKIKKLYLLLLGIHVLIGFSIYIFEAFANLYFVLVFGTFLFFLFKNQNQNNEALIAAAYITGGEVFFRMTTGSFIPHEVGKYGVIGFILLGLFFSGTSRKSGPYWLYLFLLLPGLLFTAINLNYGSDVRRAIVFNLSGPFCLGIAALYCMDRKITYKQLQYICWAIGLPVVAMAIYLFFYTPDTRSVLSGTGSNFALSGGFGPNQVSTALGLGIFAMVIQLFVWSKHKLLVIINIALLSLISYRAIITFSRGGVITALVISGLFIIFYAQKTSAKTRGRIFFYTIILLITGAITWGLSSSRTSGLIDKRYANKDAAGRIKEDVSTGRADLINAELEAFYENPITGIGIGKIKEYREEKTGISAATHNEVSRILSEHGLAGLIALGILVIYPLLYRIRNRTNYLFFSAFAFWFLTINHSSMRIAAPALIYALCLLNITYEKRNPVHRKRIVS